MIVAIIGIDGSGKSSVAKKLTEVLSQRGIKAEFNNCFEDYFLFKLPLSLVRGRRVSLGTGFRTSTQKTLINRVWPYFVLLDQLLLYLYLKVFKRGTVTITDRYAYSYIATWEYYGHSNGLIN